MSVHTEMLKPGIDIVWANGKMERVIVDQNKLRCTIVLNGTAYVKNFHDDAFYDHHHYSSNVGAGCGPSPDSPMVYGPISTDMVSSYTYQIDAWKKEAEQWRKNYDAQLAVNRAQADSKAHMEAQLAWQTVFGRNLRNGVESALHLLKSSGAEMIRADHMVRMLELFMEAAGSNADKASGEVRAALEKEKNEHTGNQ